jgi:oligopeptide/dipeptide ABC transporter ATP-binding protein
MTSLLEVEDLCITAAAPDGAELPLVMDLTFEVAGGERVALVGESGSGKSVTARSLMKLDDSVRLSGRVRLGGRELLTMSESQLAGVRGSEVSMVFQDPLSALNPTMTIGAQVAEPLLVHGVRRGEAFRRARAVLDELEVPDAARRMRAYPHEFSGGMRQRVVLAMALVNEPSLLIADEPTTALDVRVQDQVLRLLTGVAQQRELAVILITHDVGIVAGFADRVIVMYSGRSVEQAEVHDLFRDPAHPYTRGLLGAVPRIDSGSERLVALPGTPPSPAARPAGCAFNPRCPIAVERCRTDRPPLLELSPTGRPPAHRPDSLHLAACHLADVGAPARVSA